MFQDKTMICGECGGEFIFTEGEQQFYAEKGFQNEPKRCPDCRKNRKTQKRTTSSRQLVTVVCSECGCETQVPFEPKEGRPVYCRACFDNRR